MTAAPTPQKPTVWLEQAIRLHEDRRFDEAKTLYLKVLEIHPHHAGTRHMLGLAEHQSGQYDAAIMDMEMNGLDSKGHDLMLVDLNGDGVPDLVVATEPGPVRVLSGNGDGTFLSEPIFEHRWAGGAKAVATGDFDGDGIEDAAVTNWNSHDVLVLIGGRDEIRTDRVPGGGDPWGVTAGDLTGDGAAELLVLDNSGDALRVYSAGPVD